MVAEKGDDPGGTQLKQRDFLRLDSWDAITVCSRGINSKAAECLLSRPQILAYIHNIGSNGSFNTLYAPYVAIPHMSIISREMAEAMHISDTDRRVRHRQ